MASSSYSICERFRKNLIHHRHNADLSQEELGFLADLHRTEIGMLERGVRLPRIDTVVKLAGALGVTPNDLLEGIEWTPGDRPEGTFQAPER